jgi:uncharacterized protein (UPF0303 family)
METITNANDHKSSKHTMHIKRKYHVIHEFVKNGDIKVCKVGTTSNTTNPIAKSLPLAKYVRHVGAINIRYMKD